MRLLIGIILGIALTITAAYVHDSRIDAARGPGPFPPAPIAGGKIVNWDVLGAVANNAVEGAKAEWYRLTGK